MHKLLTLLAAATFTFSTVSAGDAPAAGDQPKPPGATAEGDQNRGRDGFMRRMVEENPELQGVDLNSPEGQEKVRAIMAKRMEAEAPRIRQRMAENQAAQHAELNKALGMAPEEFDAIKPLLLRVENLRMQKGLVDNVGRPPGMGRGGTGGNNRGRNNFFNPQMLLGDTPLEPTVQEIQESGKALKALVDDKQANATELASAVAKLRKARQGFDAVFSKAQEELRAVLTPQQEAILVDNGTLD
jgi:Spy/CpxP family protein refolding chaperone